MTIPKEDGKYFCRWTLKEPLIAIYCGRFIEVSTFTGVLEWNGSGWWSCDNMVLTDEQTEELIIYSKAT